MKLSYSIHSKAPTLFLTAALIWANQPNLINAQQAGNLEQEQKPTITLKECTNSGGCISSQAKLTLDANWRWIHETSGYTNCYTGNEWTSSHCTPTSDPGQCAQNCALEGVTADKYLNTYGVEQVDNGVKLQFVTDHQFGSNVGSRLYVMEDDETYKMFYLKNREFAIEVEVSNLFCGMNGAMYFVEMDEQGGKGLNQNQAGAKYGTGYCDAQCPHDIKFISGEGNNVDWVPNPNDLSNNMGIGKYGACCAEMDIWEANSMATAYTPHTCDSDITQYRCEGTDCGDNASGDRYNGVCDKDGCDINPFRMGNQNFYGRGDDFEVNTLESMTLVTQFITDDGTDDGNLVEIKRFYVQNGQIIHSPPSTILDPVGLTDSDSINDQFCVDKKILFNDVNDYMEKGGTSGMGDSLDRGQVMVISLWDDVEVNMLWLDSAYPLDQDPSEPGVLRGECPGGETSTPTYLRNTHPDSYVIFKTAAIGEIGSTLMPSPTDSPTSAPCEYCAPRPGVNEPECNNQPYAACMNMINNEGKCMWVDCAPTSSPIVTPTTSAPTSSPVLPLTPAPTIPPVPSPTNSPTIARACLNQCYTVPDYSWEQKCAHPKCSLCPECSPTQSPTSSPNLSSPTDVPVPTTSSQPTNLSDQISFLIALLQSIIPTIDELLQALIDFLNSLSGNRFFP